MSYSLTLACGCKVYVSCHPVTGLAHSRIIERRDRDCPVRMHEVGRRLQIWELLPERTDQSSAPPLARETRAAKRA